MLIQAVVPGLPRDRRGYSPLYYRGLRQRMFQLDLNISKCFVINFSQKRTKNIVYESVVSNLSLMNEFHFMV